MAFVLICSGKSSFLSSTSLFVLLSALPEGSRYSDVLGIRARPMPAATKYNAQEREWLAKAKAACALELDDKQRAQAYEQGVKALFAGLVAWAERTPEQRGEDHG
jgi:hypothetical protein